MTLVGTSSLDATDDIDDEGSRSSIVGLLGVDDDDGDPAEGTKLTIESIEDDKGTSLVTSWLDATDGIDDDDKDSLGAGTSSLDTNESIEDEDSLEGTSVESGDMMSVGTSWLDATDGIDDEGSRSSIVESIEDDKGTSLVTSWLDATDGIDDEGSRSSIVGLLGIDDDDGDSAEGTGFLMTGSSVWRTEGVPLSLVVALASSASLADWSTVSAGLRIK